MMLNSDSDKLTEDFLRSVLADNKAAGTIAKHVGFKILAQNNSRTWAQSFNVQLEGLVRDRGRRYGNSGSYGAGEHYAATYDEWGFFLGLVYTTLPELTVGQSKHPIYEDFDAFLRATGETYNSEILLKSLTEDPKDDPYPYVFGRGGNGRYGSGRSDGESLRGRTLYAGWYRDMDDAYARWQAGKKQGNEQVRYLPRTVKSYSAWLAAGGHGVDIHAAHE